MESQQSATFRLWFPNIYMTEAPSPSCVYSTVTLCISCSFQPGDFIHTLGDAHVYSNHVEPLKQQVGL